MFEHVLDWRHFLQWASTNLSVDGEFIVLCPNYSFPFETHFNIPILLNKRITHRVFAKDINKFEKKLDAEGLWKSLNFVKKREIKSYIRKQKELGLECQDDLGVIDDMVLRTASDPQFRQRQALIGKIAVFLVRVGLFDFLKLFPNFLPYMKLIFRRVS